MVAASLSVTYPRSFVVDFTFAFSEDPISILIPFPQLDSTISGIIKPFQYEACLLILPSSEIKHLLRHCFHFQVWIGIFLSLLIAAIALQYISKVEARIYGQSFHVETGWFHHFWFLFRVLASRKITSQYKAMSQ